MVNLALQKIYIHLPQYTQERMKRNNHVKKPLENDFYTNTGSNITRDEFDTTNNDVLIIFETLVIELVIL